jgi:hypothetical protein
MVLLRTAVIRSSSAKLLIRCFGLGVCVCVPGLPRSARRVVVDRASYCLSSGSFNALLFVLSASVSLVSRSVLVFLPEILWFERYS